MKKRTRVLLTALSFVSPLCIGAQLWAPILNPSQAIDWSKSGVGGIPVRLTNCASLTSSATLAQINSALAKCPSGQSVFLASGTYSIPGSIIVPSNVTLRGAGANQTILNATGKSGYVIAMGSGGPSWTPTMINITGDALAGSTRIAVSSTSGISVGRYLVITEANNPSFVTNSGSEGICGWCDGTSHGGVYARGQVVAVTGVNGNTISIAPGLYGAYSNEPVAVAFSMSTFNAGVEDLQVYANNTGYSANFGMYACAYCWIMGVESNYTDGDHVQVYWGYHDEVRDSYFSNAYLHGPGSHDSDIVLAEKTSASLVENNIVERTHVAIMLEWGAAGNVISYNYTMGEFDSGAINVVIGGIDYHGAHPQYNLLEGNVVTKVYQDSIWGSSSQTTAYRNWVVGTNRICSQSPSTGRGKVSCSGSNGHYGFQAARAMDLSYLATSNNFVANVVGSSQMQTLIKLYSPGGPLTQTASVEYPSTRRYDGFAYGWSFGFGEASDFGGGTGCGGGPPPCHRSGTSASDLLHGNYNNVDGSIAWISGLTQTLPASLYLPGKPDWWGSMPYPATGPDVVRGPGPGGHSYGNPAQACYLAVMGGSDGGSGSPLVFNADICFGKRSLAAKALANPVR